MTDREAEAMLRPKLQPEPFVVIPSPMRRSLFHDVRLGAADLHIAVGVGGIAVIVVLTLFGWW